MANVLSNEKQQQILALGRLGWSLRKIEGATGVRRETASAYLKAAGIKVRPAPQTVAAAKPASGAGVSTDSAAAKPASGAGVSTDSAAAKPASGAGVSTDVGACARPKRAPTTSACEPYREEIEQALRLGRNAMAIYQDLVTEHGFGARYASVKRFVRKLAARPAREAHVVIGTRPGAEGQVDWGEGPMVRNRETGKYVRTRLFVFTLAHSRKSVRLLSFKSSSRIWAELHEEAFRRVGGTPHVIVLDNLREGVVKPDIYDPTLNPLYADVLRHYGATALPCRVGDPDRKGKVESGVGHAQRTPLRGLRFETIEAAQSYLDRWEERWADTRIHGTVKQQVSLMWAEEKPHLLPLPVEPFRYYEFGTRTVHLDGHVEVAGAYYASPPGMIGRTLPVQWDGKRVRLMDPHTRQLLIEHDAQPRGRYSTPEICKPSRTPPTTLQLLAWTGHAGKHIGALCREIHRCDGESGVKRILGVRSLVRVHGVLAVEGACKAALEMGAPTYRFVKHYLKHRAQPPIPLRQIDPLIRELTHYRDHINNMTKETPDEPR
jgi:transposase